MVESQYFIIHFIVEYIPLCVPRIIFGKKKVRLAGTYLKNKKYRI